MKLNYFVILVNYCNPQLTVDCISSLNEAGCGNEKIIVVDNASPDNSLDVLGKINKIKLISAPMNGGFSYGNNLGIRYAMEQRCTNVILLNNDTVVDKEFFCHIFNGDSNKVNVPKIYYYAEPDTLWYAGGEIDYKKGLTKHIGENQKDAPKFSKEKDVDFACGCCMMIPRAVLEKVGLLDEKYFMYWEDTDYSMRLKEAGIKIHYLPDAKIWHKVGMSAGKQSKLALYYGNRNRFYLLKTYHFNAWAWIYTIATRIMKYVASFFNKSNDRLILRAWKDYKYGIMGRVEL